MLIYKATEVVNFAQGDLMMLGGFVAFSVIDLVRAELLGRRALAILDHRCLRLLLDVVIIRRVIGQPQFAVVMLTLGLGFIFRAVRGHHLGL